ncbi:MAG: hypothetical protein ACLGIG_05120 [Actinomycetes bacterium]
MSKPQSEDKVSAAAFLVETRKREEANRRAASLPQPQEAAPPDEDAQLRAAAALVANRAQREATERVAGRLRPGESANRAR